MRNILNEKVFRIVKCDKDCLPLLSFLNDKFIFSLDNESNLKICSIDKDCVYYKKSKIACCGNFIKSFSFRDINNVKNIKLKRFYLLAYNILTNIKQYKVQTFRRK